MKKSENIEEFYQRKFGWLPNNYHNQIGHFNLFQLDPFVGKNAKPIPYQRRDYYKIMLVIGNSKVHYADKILEVQKQALTFSNPQIPYKWESTDGLSGFYCIFDRHFFHQFGNINQYVVFQPEGNPLIELNDKQVYTVQKLFARMFSEMNSEYLHKYDVLRNLVFELLHFAMKTQPSSNIHYQQSINASQRIATLFLELLERQFPIDDTHSKISLRSASEFANQLNIHVNHLNKALKETMQKTTSQFISERILQESKILLKHSSWNISEIAFSLGFTEVTHFNNFFKKHTKLSPSKFRKA